MVRTKAPSTALEAIVRHRGPSAWDRFVDSPCLYLARLLHDWLAPVRPAGIRLGVSVACISDTHNVPVAVPEADILVHAGDLTKAGTPDEVQAAIDWLDALPHPHKVVIAGNHDLCLDPAYKRRGQSLYAMASLDWKSVTYLHDQAVTLRCRNGRDVTVYGSPMTPRYGTWAFQYPREERAWQGRVPDGVDILLSHGPPMGHLDDKTYGCAHLAEELWRARPALHVFGHVHEGCGMQWAPFDAVQRWFEYVCRQGGGLGGLGMLVLAAIMSLLAGGRRPGETLLVNAARLTGMKEELQRNPVVVNL